MTNPPTSYTTSWDTTVSQGHVPGALNCPSSFCLSRALSEQIGLSHLAKSLSVYECKTPSRYFNSSPEIIRLAVIMYVRFPLSLRQVEELLTERGINICHQTVWFCGNRFGPLFAAEIGKRRVHHHWCSCGSTGRPNRISLHDVRAIANGDRLRCRDLRRSADQ